MGADVRGAVQDAWDRGVVTPYYQDDWVTVYNGDALEVLPTLTAVDLVVTSPPYGDIREYGGQRTDLLRVMGSLGEGINLGGVIVWNTSDQTVDGSESGESFRQALFMLDAGLRLHDTMIYCKETVTYPDANRYHPAFEYMFVFSKGAPRHFNGLKDKRNRTPGSRPGSSYRQRDGSLSPKRPKIVPELGLRLNWWVLSTASQERGDAYLTQHPARMPIGMARDHILTWTVEGETVLDPFAGSGTTLRAAKDLGRRAIGIEIEERYCEIAATRCSQEVLGLSFVS